MVKYTPLWPADIAAVDFIDAIAAISYCSGRCRDHLVTTDHLVVQVAHSSGCVSEINFKLEAV